MSKKIAAFVMTRDNMEMFRLSEPYPIVRRDYDADKDVIVGFADYVMVSHSLPGLVSPETMIFPCDKSGTVLSFRELAVAYPWVEPNEILCKIGYEEA